MKQGTGLPVFPGIAIGPAAVFRDSRACVSHSSGNPEIEKAKFRAALEKARKQLAALYEKSRSELGEDPAAMVEVQLLLLEDPELSEAVTAAIEGGSAAAAAVEEAGNALAQVFESMEDTYMQARGADIRDLCGRLRDILCGEGRFSLPEGPFLVAAEDLAPSQTVSLPRDRLLGFVTRQGSPLSHTAILARTWNLPALVQADIAPEGLENCRVLAVDGFSGTWYADPDEATLAMLTEKQTRAAAEQQALEAYRGVQTRTRSGTAVLLGANIGSAGDTEAAKLADAEGIGLLRSEFLYLGRTTPPKEEELFSAYQRVAQAMGPLPVVIRTLDIGADKQAPCLTLAKEENPALGLRGIRLCLDREDLFRNQLRAIYRASVFGNLRILFPMISSLWELKAAKAVCRQVREALTRKGVPFRDIPVGIMIETPAAAISADALARESDFFSVGTNDLTQYTLAADRQNAGLEKFYDPRHPALLALLSHVARAARKAGIPAGICGELAADPDAQETLIRMGYHELSMAPGRILESRKRICQFEI